MKKFALTLIILISHLMSFVAYGDAIRIDGVSYYFNYSDTTASVAEDRYPHGEGSLYTDLETTIPAYVDYDNLRFKVTTINQCAFRESEIEILHLPETVVNLNPVSLSSMHKLRIITVSEENPALQVVDNVLFSKDMKILWLYPVFRGGKPDSACRIEKYVVPEGVEELYLGFENTGLKHISFPSTLKKIGNYGLRCETLTELTLPESLEYLGWNALTNLTISGPLHLPDNISYIGDDCFENSKFTSVNIPLNITRIGEGWFRKSDISSIEFHDHVTTIESLAFYEASKLKELALPESVVEIENGAFGWSNIESLKLGMGIERIGDVFWSGTSLTDIYCSRYIAPEVDTTYPLGLEWTLGEVNVHVRPGCAAAYEKTPWKLVGPIIEDYLTGIDEVEADTAIGADELCDVYTLSGAAAASMCRYGDLRNSLPKGLYIVRTASGKSSKIAVK